VVLAALLVVIAAALVLQVGPVGRRVARLVLERVVSGSVADVRAVNGFWLRGVGLEGVRLASVDSAWAIEADSLVLSYALAPLLGRRAVVHRLDVMGARVEWDGCRWAQRPVASAAPAAPGARSAATWAVHLDSTRVESLQLHGTICDGGVPSSFAARDVVLGGRSIDLAPALGAGSIELSATLRPPGAGDGYLVSAELRAGLANGRLTLDTLALRSPGSDVHGSGELQLPGSQAGATVDGVLRVTVARLDFNDLQPYASRWLASEGSAQATATVTRSGDVLSVDADVAVRDGGTANVVASGTLRGVSGSRYEVSATATGLNPARLLARGPDAAFDARLEADLAGDSLAASGGSASLELEDVRAPGVERRLTLDVVVARGDGVVNGEVSWAGSRATFAGTVRPFAGPPGYDLRADLRSEAGALPPSWGAWTRRIGGPLAARLAVTGSGIRLADATLTAGLDVGAFELGRGSVGPARLDVQADSGRVALTWGGDLGGGRGEGAGSVSVRDTVRFAVSRLSLTDVDLAGLMGDTIWSRVNVDLSAQGTGIRWSDLAGTVHLQGGPLAYGRYALRSLVADAVLTRGGLDATSTLGLGSGEMDVTLRGDPRASEATFMLSGRSAALDLGALVGASSWSTALDGDFDGRFRRATASAPSELAGTVRLGRSRIGTVELDAGSLDLSLAQGRLAIAGGVTSSGSTIDLAGNATPFDSVPTFVLDSARLRALDLGGLADSPRLASNLSGTLVGRAEGNSLASLRASLDLRLTAGSFRSTAIDSSRITAAMDSGAVGLHARLAGPWGDVAVDGMAGLDVGDTTYTASGTVNLEDLVGLLGSRAPAGHLRGDFQMEGRGLSLGSMTTSGRVRGSGRVWGVELDSMQLVGGMDAGTLRVDSESIWSPGGFIEAAGGLPLSPSATRDADLTVSLTVESLVAFGLPLGIDSLVVQGGTMRVDVTGPTDSLHVVSTAGAEGVDAGRFGAARMDAALSARLGATRNVRSATANARLLQATTAGLQLASTGLTVSYDSAQYRMTLESSLDERRHARLVARLDPTRSAGVARVVRVVRVEELDLGMDEDEWALQAEAALTLGGAPRVDEVILTSGTQRLEIHGGVDPSGTQDLAVSLADFRIAAISDLLGFPALGGTLDGTFDLSGPVDSTTARASILAAVTDAGAAVGTVRATARVTGGTLTIDAGLSRSTDSTAVTVRGTLPAAVSVSRPDSAAGSGRVVFPDGPVDLSIRADSLALEWLHPFLDPTVTADLGGVLRANVQVRGSAFDPALSGDVSLDGVRVSFPELGMHLTGGAAAAVLSAREVRLDTASVRSGRGVASIGGVVTLVGRSPPELALRAHLVDFDASANHFLEGTVTGDLTVTGTFGSPRVAATLDVLRSEVLLDGPWAASDGATVELTEADRRMLLETFGVSPSASAPQPGLYDASDLSLDLVLGQDNWARRRSNPMIALQFTGAVDLEKRPHSSPVFNGSALIVSDRGYISQFGRRFRVRSGNVVLAGPVEQGQIELDAEYPVPSRQNPGAAEVTITLSVRGTASDLQVILGSDPAMENADIVSYIATGRPASQGLTVSGSGQSTVLGTGAVLARDQLVGVVQQEAMSRIGLDVVEIRTGDVNGTTLVAGRYVSPRLYLGFQQPLSTRDPTATGTRPYTEVEIEYEAFRWLVVNLHGGASTLGFLLRSRYAY
jgi:translocation and assembly module TamB